MKFLGRQLNDLLEMQGDGRPLEDNRFYMQWIGEGGGKLIPMEQWFTNIETALREACEAYDKSKDETYEE